jgi:hypothetical protein
MSSKDSQSDTATRVQRGEFETRLRLMVSYLISDEKKKREEFDDEAEERLRTKKRLTLVILSLKRTSGDAQFDDKDDMVDKADKREGKTLTLISDSQFSLDTSIELLRAVCCCYCCCCPHAETQSTISWPHTHDIIEKDPRLKRN